MNLPMYEVPKTDEMAAFQEVTHLMSNHFITQDLLRLILGPKIGAGAFRAVYENRLDKNTVIKIAPVEPSANQIEMAVWESMQKTRHEKWLAPCHYISPCGHILIQSKVVPIPEGHKLPKSVPMMFTDVKRENWGLMNGWLVCHDYQFLCRALDYSMMAKRTVKWVSTE